MANSSDDVMKFDADTLPNIWVRAHPFGHPKKKDAHGEYFSPETKFYDELFPNTVVNYYHSHTPDGKWAPKPILIGKTIERKYREDGRWDLVEFFDKEKIDPDVYERVGQAIEDGTLRSSPTVVPDIHAVDSSGHITDWATGSIAVFDATEGRRPANWDAIGALEMKSMFEQVGLKFPVMKTGNPNHDEQGRFASGSSSGGSEKSITDLVAEKNTLRKKVDAGEASDADYDRIDELTDQIKQKTSKVVDEGKQKESNERTAKDKERQGKPYYGIPLNDSEYAQAEKYNALDSESLKKEYREAVRSDFKSGNFFPGNSRRVNVIASILLSRGEKTYQVGGTTFNVGYSHRIDPPKAMKGSNMADKKQPTLEQRFIHWFKSLAQNEQDDFEEIFSETDDKGSTEDSESILNIQQQKQKEDAEAIRLEYENKMKAMQAEHNKLRLENEAGKAGAWFKALLDTGKVLPAEESAITTLYLYLSETERTAHPVMKFQDAGKETEATPLDVFKRSIEQRQPILNLNENQLKFFVIKNEAQADANKAPTAERTEKLLEGSELGRAVLAERSKSNGKH